MTTDYQILDTEIFNFTCINISETKFALTKLTISCHFITRAPKNLAKCSFCAPNDGESCAAMFTYQKNLSDFYGIDNRFWPLFRNRSKSQDFCE